MSVILICNLCLRALCPERWVDHTHCSKSGAPSDREEAGRGQALTVKVGCIVGAAHFWADQAGQMMPTQ